MCCCVLFGYRLSLLLCLVVACWCLHVCCCSWFNVVCVFSLHVVVVSCLLCVVRRVSCVVCGLLFVAVLR